MEPAELSEIAVDREVFRVLAKRLPQDPPKRKSEHENEYISPAWSKTFILAPDLESPSARIGKASTNFGRLSSRVWKNHHLTIKLKIKVYTACILSVLLYSSETWCTYRRQVNRLNAFNFRCLRWLGHVHCMEDGRLPKDILYGEFYNAPRWTGRPKLRYKDVIKRDMAGFHISHGKHLLPIATDDVPLWVTVIHYQFKTT